MLRAQSEEEKDALIKEYSDKMAAAQDDIEQQKQKKLRDVRRLLKEERKRRKKELYKYALPLFLSLGKVKCYCTLKKKYLSEAQCDFILNGRP